MNKKVINIIIAIIIGLVLWYFVMKLIDKINLSTIPPFFLMFALVLYAIFLKPLLIFITGWSIFKIKSLNFLVTFYSFLHLFICFITLPLLFRDSSFENIWSTFSLLFVYIIFRLIAVFIGMKEMATFACPSDVAFKYHFLFPFYKPNRYFSAIVEKTKPVTFLKGYSVTLLLFFIVELILSGIKFILRSLVG